MIEDCTDIINAISAIGTVEEFKKNRIIHKAVIYSFFKLGGTMQDFVRIGKGVVPDNSWNKIISFRNRSSHGYHHLDLDIVYEIATKYVPDLYEVLQKQSLL